MRAAPPPPPVVVEAPPVNAPIERIWGTWEIDGGADSFRFFRNGKFVRLNGSSGRFANEEGVVRLRWMSGNRLRLELRPSGKLRTRDRSLPLHRRGGASRDEGHHEHRDGNAQTRSAREGA